MKFLLCLYNLEVVYSGYNVFYDNLQMLVVEMGISGLVMIRGLE